MFYTVNNFKVELEKNGLPIGEQFIRNAIKRKDIKSTRIGKRIFIPEEELSKILGSRKHKIEHRENTVQAQNLEILTKQKLLEALKEQSYRILAYELERCIFLDIDNENRIMRIAVPKNTNKKSVEERLTEFMGKYEIWEIITEYKEQTMLDEAKKLIASLSRKGIEECKIYMKRWEL